MAVGEHGQVDPGLTGTGGLRNGQTSPLEGLPAVAFFLVALADQAHGVTPLVEPGGLGHGQVLVQGRQGLVPHAVEGQLARVVKGVTRTARVLGDRYLE